MRQTMPMFPYTQLMSNPSDSSRRTFWISSPRREEHLFQAPDGHDEEIISRLESDLRRRYVVGFRPNPLMSYKVRHNIRIEVTQQN